MGLLFWNQGIRFLLGVVALGCLMFYPEVSFAAENGENIVQQSTNKEGTQIVRLKYNAINGFSEGVTTARINNAWVILDTAGNTIMSENAAIEDMTYSKNGLIQFKENKKWGYMNYQGDKVIEAKYDSVTDFLKS